MATPIRELLITVKVEADEKPLEKVGDASDTAKIKSQALGTALGSLGADLVKVGLEAVKAAGAFAVDLVTGFAESGDEVAKTAQKIGVGVDELQRLRFAGERSGIAAEQLTSGIRDFNTQLQEGLIKESGPAVDFIGELGLELSDLADLGAEDRIGLVADALGAVESEGEKSALAIKLFGGAGADILPLLEEGSAGIKALGDEAEALGGVMSEEAAGSAAELADSLFNLDTFIDGTKRQLSEALAPAASEVIDQVRELIEENDQFIQQDLPEILKAAADLFLEIAPLVIDTVSAFASINKEVSDFNERMGEDWPVAWDLAKEAVLAMLSPITFVIDSVTELIDLVTKAASDFEALAGAASAVRKAVGLDQEATVQQRGLAGVERVTTEVFEGGTAETAGRSAVFVGEGTTDEGLAAIIADPNASDAVRAEASNLQDLRFVENMIAAGEKQAADNARDAERAALLGRARAGRARNVARRGRGGGGGGGGGGGAAQPTIDELVAAASGIPGGEGPSAAAAGALAGTVLVTNDNRFMPQITNTITVEVDGGALELETTDQGRLTALMREVVGQVNRETLLPIWERATAGGTP
jgi:hypothetical protein